MKSPRTILAGAGVALAVLAAAAPASAHSGGRVQLFVDRLGLHSTGGNDWTVSVTMVDADSGSPQPGFDVVAEGRPTPRPPGAVQCRLHRRGGTS